MIGRAKPSPLVRLIGFPATILQGDPMVLDRWRWLSAHLPRVLDGSFTLLDLGCGQGAMTIGAARRGYRSTGVTWDVIDRDTASERAAICNAPLANFEIADVRHLHTRADFRGAFDVVVCTEVIEHILDDRKLLADIADILRPGGRLLLTTPNYDYRPITAEDAGPFAAIEDGRHVRKGYTAETLVRMCQTAKLRTVEIGYISGFVSQQCTRLMRWCSPLPNAIRWAVTLPLRPLPLVFDGGRQDSWPSYSICIEARKDATS